VRKQSQPQSLSDSATIIPSAQRLDGLDYLLLDLVEANKGLDSQALLPLRFFLTPVTNCRFVSIYRSPRIPKKQGEQFAPRLRSSIAQTDRDTPGGIPQIYFQNVAYFSSPKTVRIRTTLWHRFTTNSPSKTTLKAHTFLKPPSKNAQKPQKITPPPRQKKISQKRGLG
jgi:hypothetical protein